MKGLTDWRSKYKKLEKRCQELMDRVDKAERELAFDRSIYADQPEDRLYHAADNTWWKRESDGHLYGADPPKALKHVTRESMVSFIREIEEIQVAQREATIQIISKTTNLQRHLKDALENTSPKQKRR